MGSTIWIGITLVLVACIAWKASLSYIKWCFRLIVVAMLIYIWWATKIQLNDSIVKDFYLFIPKY